MNLTIAKNDAYRELCKITVQNESQLHHKILKDLELIGFLQDWTQEAGKTIQEIIDEFNDITIGQLTNHMFQYSEHIDCTELESFVGAILIWGDGEEHPCPQCGTECEGEAEVMCGEEWTNWQCTNPECDYKVSGEPDWDILPGGKDY